MTRWARKGDLVTVQRGIGEHFAALLPTEETADEGSPVARAFYGEKLTRGGKFPVLVVAQGPIRGVNPNVRGMPDEIDYRLRIYQTVTRKGDATSGQRTAEDATLRAFSAWLAALDNDVNFRRQVRNWQIVSADAGYMTDPLGRPLVTEQNLLWRLEAVVRVTL